MFENLILSAVALLHQGSGGMTFHEAKIEIPAGISRISTQMKWNAVTLFSPDGTPLPRIWYREEDTKNFLPWHNSEEKNETVNESILELLLSDGETQELYIQSESTTTAIAHFYNTRIKGERLLVQAGMLLGSDTSPQTSEDFAPLDDDSFDDPETGLARPIERPKYFSRADWGADESLRVFDPNAKGLKKWFQTEESLIAPQYRPKIIRSTNTKGEPLYWPIAQSPIVEKFIVHHTGEYVKKDRTPEETMRAIYAFHTITRGWGDIGYNYVIAKNGNIYEGRAGGIGVVGAHTAYYNIGTVGISLMGNFEYEHPTERQVEVLELLIADHAKRLNIDPNGRGFYLGTNSYNVSGHRDVARSGHGTACPGKYLYELLPQIRKNSARISDELYRQIKSDAKMARDFLQQSSVAPDVIKVGSEKFQRPEKKPLLQLSALIEKTIIQRNENKTIEFSIENNSQIVWKKNEELTALQSPQGMTVTSFRLLDAISPGETGKVRGRIMVSKTPNGFYDLALRAVFLEDSFFDPDEVPVITVPLQISGDKNPVAYANRPQVKEKNNRPQYLKNLATSAFMSSAPKSIDIPNIKVKLAHFDETYAKVGSSTEFTLKEEDNWLATLSPAESVKILPAGKVLQVITKEKTWNVSSVTLETEGILTIENYDRGIKGELKYNQFRKKLHFYPQTKNLLVVNELPIEEYLGGLAEEPSTEPEAKKHAIHVLARSYAWVYSGVRRKFNTDKYDLEDDPATSQFYLGYDWERYHIDQVELLKQTAGEVITYNGIPVVGPYFTQSNGTTSDQWHKQYPWTKSQRLPFDEGLEQKGHGVGLSGHTARILAKDLNYDYKQILHYFFDGVEIEAVSSR